MNKDQQHSELIDYEIDVMVGLITHACLTMRYGFWFSLNEAVEIFAPMTDLRSLADGFAPHVINRRTAHKMREKGLCVGTRAWIAGGHHTPVWATQTQRDKFWSMRKRLGASNKADNPRLNYERDHKHNFKEQGQ